MFGPMFEGYKEPEPEPELVEEIKSMEIKNEDPSKKKAKHGKQASKSTGLTYQFQIMQSMGVPKEDIQKFADPTHWIYYWPPIAMVCLLLIES